MWTYKFTCIIYKIGYFDRAQVVLLLFFLHIALTYCLLLTCAVQLFSKKKRKKNLCCLVNIYVFWVYLIYLLGVTVMGVLNNGMLSWEFDRYDIVEGQHLLWNGVSKPYRETIRAFLAYFQNQVNIWLQCFIFCK